ncbi:MAG TPA: hypothetical protein PLR25_08625 [Planctomycetaceae bacterium]|nr:hypothetical protein [Planctomycetaceae bacterium]
MHRTRFVSLLLLCGFAYSTTAWADEPGLLGHWKFDEGQGDVVSDSSDQANDGELLDAQWVNGPFGTALHFDGQGAHVSIPQLAGLDGSDEMTAEAWVYWEGTGRYPNILTGGTWSPGGFLMFVSDNQCSFRLGRPGSDLSGSTEPWSETSAPLVSPFALSQWYHLAATFKRPLLTTYVNGKKVGSANWDFPIGHRGDLLVGKWAGAGGHHGLIDDVKIFNRALSAAEIATEYDQGAAGRTDVPQGTTAYKQIPRASQLATAVALFENDSAKLAVSSRGRCVALIDKSTGEDRLLRTTPLVSIRIGDSVYHRSTCTLEDGKLIFRLDQADTTVVVGVTAKPQYFVFQVESVSNPQVNEVTFVDLSVKPCDRVSGMSGLAADDQFGLCLRTLNLTTRVDVGGQPPVLKATAFKEHGLETGRAALVACPMPQMIPTLQQLVRNEGLPYSALGGPFAMDAEENRGAYVFATVSERDVDAWIDLARRGGIQTVHMSGWEQSLGHYEPSKGLFPNGLAGLKAVVDKFHAAGLKVGIHTLTGCISPNDSWIHPVPDPRLATDGTYTLTPDLNETDTEVPTAETPSNHPTIWAYSSPGNCIRIDDELIQYSVVSRDGQFGFFKCRRGAFGTKVAAHKQGAAVHHMLVRYGCFIPDEKSTLVDDVADAIANVYNTCGLDQIYMDGAEAMRGWYGIARMRHAIFTRLKHPALVEASEWGHHSWPFHSRVGAWDHPKWGLKRFADDHLRAVERYRRNDLLEAQLGWWVILGPDRDWDLERPDEIEYLSAKALGYDAPLSFQNVDVTSRPENARQDELFTTIGQYERLRLANYFDDEVKQQLRGERQEFHLLQNDDGQWTFLPTDYLKHKVTALDDGTNTWTVSNRFAEQPVRLRIQALYSAFPYDDENSITLADFATDDQFTAAAAASKVTSTLQSVTEPLKAGQHSGRLTATNENQSPVGAWSRVTRSFEPVIDMTPYDALGLWVHGDGKGELLNLQLTNLPEYFHTLDDHHVKIDFTGWRYFELLLGERDAAGYHDYQWPYGAHMALHRMPLVRHAVSKLTAYLNNLPPQEQATCYLSPVKALRTRKVVLHHPTIEIDGRRLVFPVDLTSGMFIEFESPDDCRVYDERGELLQWLKPQGEVPMLQPNDNQVTFTCEGTAGFQSRANVTLVTSGAPLAGRRPLETIDWSLLAREYDNPRTIMALDGHQNKWQTICRNEAKSADVEIEVSIDQLGGETTAYDAPTAMTLDSFEPPDASLKPATTFAYDTAMQASGCSPGVSQQLTRSSDIVKLGAASACYTASSTLDNNGGWSVKYQRYTQPLDLSRFAALGFWLHGDGNGQSFKLQLLDKAGGWQDMYTTVDFKGWRYCQFALGGPNLKDPANITAMNLYYNGIPAGRTATCYVDEIRALAAPEPLGDVELTIAGQSIRFPVAMNAGDRLFFKSMTDCQLVRASGAVESVQPVGSAPKLSPGKNPVVVSIQKVQPDEFRAVVKLIKVYP